MQNQNGAPLKKLRISNRGVRGTEDAVAMLELIEENWVDLQSAFQGYTTEEQE